VRLGAQPHLNDLTKPLLGNQQPLSGSLSLTKPPPTPIDHTQVSGVRIKISDRTDYVPGTRNRKVTVTGTLEAVQIAQFLISQKVQQVSSWVTLMSRWVTLRARWVTLRARWVTFTVRR
jgi:hypothetical protein